MKKAVFAALFALSSSVFAQGYVGVGVGQSSVDINAGPIGLVQPTIEDTDTSFKIFGGALLNQNLGVEVGYVNFGEVSVRWDDGIDYIEDTWETSALYVAGLAVIPMNDQAGLMIKAGFASWDMDAKETSSIPGIGVSLSESGTDPMIGIGFQFAVDNLMLRAEFERFMDIGDENTTGQSDIDIIGLSAAVKF